ncbi:L-seryl-tRNA(Sec) selenium transferase [Desulfogranum japonicum]|uniref:L-seryl-tRNA(Sec) selenium transferase n=1 Tax=Desulfogranum japonicum TaxID=231447 RepID=UPI000402A03A|nr:L-seryl-tRNA(Sec) selenium transferase [Desulfogranum japonicum]
MQDINTKLRAIPKVDECLRRLESHSQLDHIPLMQKTYAIRNYLQSLRQRLLADDPCPELGKGEAHFTQGLVGYVLSSDKPRFQRVVNGSGVIIHTNMGRSLLPQITVDMLANAAKWYSNLEFDLKTGKRGSRYSHVEDLICLITGAEAALVVNNNAAAVLIVLETLAKQREVIVSRGQLVEIGGSFRIPEVMERSGAKLVEVGATNRTHLRDYEIAINERTGALLRVHCSNYRIVGFTKEVSNEELVALGHQHSLPVIEDLGSGCFVDLKQFGLEHEPTVQEVVKSGVDVITFSGDKLLGGPQAGIILGKKTYIEKIKRNPLNRALRIDKFTLAALESVLRLYRDEERAFQLIPTLAMIADPLESLASKAEVCIAALKQSGLSGCRFQVVDSYARVGGGAMPEQSLASKAVAFTPDCMGLVEFEKQLRGRAIPIIGRIENRQLLIDMRTIQEDEISLVVQAIFEICSGVVNEREGLWGNIKRV